MKKVIISFLAFCIAFSALAQPTGTEKLFGKKHIKSVMVKATEWQLANPKHEPRDWTNGAFYAGVFAAWETTKSKNIYKALMDMGEKAGWRPYRRRYHADSWEVYGTGAFLLAGSEVIKLKR